MTAVVTAEGSNEAMAPRKPPAKPPQNPFYAPYVPANVQAETRARWRRFIYGAAAAIAVTLALMLFGYTDQAPAWLRAATENSMRCSAFRCCG